MVTLKQAAQDYKSTTTKNIADLEKVPTNLELIDDSFEVEENGKIKTVNQQVIMIDEIKYRIPASVVAQLQVLIEDSPDMTHFKVKKTGTGMDTRYLVIPSMA